MNCFMLATSQLPSRVRKKCFLRRLFDFNLNRRETKIDFLSKRFSLHPQLTPSAPRLKDQEAFSVSIKYAHSMLLKTFPPFRLFCLPRSQKIQLKARL
jgi:hypothetical protein